MSSTSKHPKGLLFLAFTEFWERFGYYLMIGIFFLYMTTDMKDGGFGWDIIFIPNSKQQNRSEMSTDVYQQHYKESKNFAGVRAFLLARTNK